MYKPQPDIIWSVSWGLVSALAMLPVNLVVFGMLSSEDWVS